MSRRAAAILATSLMTCTVLMTCSVLTAVPAAAAGPDPAGAVNPFIGTGSGGPVVGDVDAFPGATVPFGMVQWSPDTPGRPSGGMTEPFSAGVPSLL